MKIDYQTIYIIVIIIFFNFLLLNIFRLQNDIQNINKNIKDNKNINGFNSNKYKLLNNNNNSIGDIKSKLNDIASIVPIDVNKIDKTNANFVPKFKQVDNL
uniref:Uncharacterized protein n=1 Tax=viral metagenome TaxID=1070528 RepID=A0A6C0C584_9ZZZZ